MVALVCLGAVSLVLLGCVGRDRPSGANLAEAEEAASTGGAAANNAATDDPAGASAEASIGGEAPAAESGSPGAEAVDVRTPRFFVPNGRLERRVPTDAMIGPLLDGVAGEHAGIYAVASGFLAVVADPEAALEFVEPENRTMIGRLLVEDVPEDSEIVHARVGTIQWLGAQEVTLAVRVFAQIAATDGRIVLVNRSGKWYISDMLINFRELGIPDDRTVYRLEPWADRSPLVGP